MVKSTKTGSKTRLGSVLYSMLAVERTTVAN